MKRYFLIAVLAALASPACFGQDEVTLKGSVDKKIITIGDRVTYDVTFRLPAGFELVQPQKTESLGSWEVKDIRNYRDEKDGLPHLAYTLTTYTTGKVTIPPLDFNYTDAAKAEKKISSRPVPVTVESVLAREGNAGDIRDIKPPLSMPLPWHVYALWLLIACAAAAGFLFWYQRYRQKLAARFPVPAVPAVPPQVTALERLEALKKSGLIAEGRIKEYYIALGDIIRDYLSAFYGIDARDMTTAELFAALRPRETDKKRLSEIKDFFCECDLVKFAKYRPEERVCLEDWDKAKTIVELKAESNGYTI